MKTEQQIREEIAKLENIKEHAEIDHNWMLIDRAGFATEYLEWVLDD